MKRGFAGIHPIVQLLYYGGVMALCMMVKHPIYLALLLAIMVASNLAQDRGRRLRSYLPLYLVSGAALMILTPLTSHRGATILGYLFDNPITLEAVLYGVTSGMSVMTLLLSCTSFQIAVDADALLYLLAPPLPNTTMVILIALRFVPHFKIRLREISEIQGTRPGRVGSGLRAGVRSAMQVCNILLARSLEDAVFTAQSMRTRGYHLTRKRSFYFQYKMDRQNLIFLFVVIILLFSLLGFGLTGVFAATLYPRIALGTVTPLRITAAVVFVAFSAIPIFLGGVDHGTN